MSTLLLLAGLLVQEPGDDQIRKWISQLGAEYLEEREEAKAQLAKTGAKAERLLAGALTHADHQVRGASLELLVGMKSTQSVPAVITLFKEDPDKAVRALAFDYLRQAGKPAEEILIEALDSDEPGFRLGAAQRLKEIKSEKCAGRVAKLYDKEQDPAIKTAAFECLKNIGKPAQPYLLDLLGSADPAVRKGALDGLRNIYRTAPDEEVVKRISAVYSIETDTAVLDSVYDLLKSARAVDSFVAGLRSGQDVVRLKSIDGLTELKSDQGIDAAAELFEEDAVEAVRAKAQAYLEGFGPRSEPHFIKALGNANPQVKIRSIQALAKLQSAAPLETIARLFRENPDKAMHQTSFDYLSSMGLKAEKELIAALEDGDPAIKRRAIEALGRGASVAAIPRLVDFLAELNREIKEAATAALVRIGPKALDSVNAAVRDGKIPKRSAEEILALFYQEEVERLLGRIVSEQGEYGYFDGMFGGLQKFGTDKAVPVLLKIAKDRSYQARIDDGNRPERFSSSIRGLALMALGELGDKDAVETLEGLVKGTSPTTYDTEFIQIAVSLFKLGRTKPLEEFIQGWTREGREKAKGESLNEACDRLHFVALVQNRIGRRDEAEKMYLEVIQVLEREKKQGESSIYDAALYNLACLAALKGDKAKAVDWLRRAVEAGYKDKGWIQTDRDLESLRNEEGYKKLLSNEALWRPKD